MTRVTVTVFTYLGNYILFDGLLSSIRNTAHGTAISQLAIITDEHGGEHVCFRRRWCSDTADTVCNVFMSVISGDVYAFDFLSIHKEKMKKMK
jgi:hypothetical protein